MSAKIGRKRSDKERQEILTALEAWIAEGKTLREFCRQEGRPSWKTVYTWLNEDESFATRIAHARELGEEAISQECLAIADTPIEGIERKLDDNGKVIETKVSDMLGHRKLQIETRLKLLAKWNPRKWGDKLGLEHAGKDGGPLEWVVRFERDPGA